jgi:hypothetical protein
MKMIAGKALQSSHDDSLTDRNSRRGTRRNDHEEVKNRPRRSQVRERLGLPQPAGDPLALDPASPAAINSAESIDFSLESTHVSRGPNHMRALRPPPPHVPPILGPRYAVAGIDLPSLPVLPSFRSCPAALPPVPARSSPVREPGSVLLPGERAQRADNRTTEYAPQPAKQQARPSPVHRCSDIATAADAAFGRCCPHAQ